MPDICCLIAALILIVYILAHLVNYDKD